MGGVTLFVVALVVVVVQSLVVVCMGSVRSIMSALVCSSRFTTLRDYSAYSTANGLVQWAIRVL